MAASAVVVVASALLLWPLLPAASGGTGAATCAGGPCAAAAAASARAAFLASGELWLRRTAPPSPHTACCVVRRRGGRAEERGRGGPERGREQGRGQGRGRGGGGARARGVRRETHLERNERLGQVADSILQGLGQEFAWRAKSNDANAIVEVFGCQALGKTPAYLCSQFDFSPRGHVVLDLGGHIGAFGLFAVLQGASHVTAYEPHPANAALYRSNTRHLPVTLHQVALTADYPPPPSASAAIAASSSSPSSIPPSTPPVSAAGDVHPTQTDAGPTDTGEQGKAALVVGREYQGVTNTWRHSLAPYSHYKGPVDTVTVSTMPFSKALTDEVTFVKMDCEGAELDILPQVKTWRKVEKLVFEYSFTKRRNMTVFWELIDSLRAHGFERIAFKDYTGEVEEGHWRAVHGDSWLGSSDALVFCSRTFD